MIVGVLALQGNYDKHLEKLEGLNCPSVLIKYPNQLSEIDGLVLPGGESTSITLLMEQTGFDSAIIDFAKNNPIFGTCAGLIIMSTTSADSSVNPLGLIDIAVKRNGYGRQIKSGFQTVDISFNGQSFSESSMFIRAPQITRIGPDVEILGTMDNDPVFVKQNHHLASCFHPEMVDNSLMYSLFISLIKSHNLAHAV
ncbi:MAG: pyridoxal 5'-phosphate synthase glutaminase subunit PdxT [Candidatus Marinimicrobia bacterium]|jgi:5'-phosphate synthase pdxT subunit|nr:pyridoxal 5'-phosphate synthase glutaminase subunit PdxT [Candidatus Neomarinimicrobiota bacterium]MBT3618485.1 pyridoxal 5'-phosphate synthase glutaminase subunit PdxT [Candidatus Neomarinimicrobiota bacterium]MBT3828891.1 pyridoxal 5'-phosphate synthase glutaminase subunit PdxT [Candidatus Neomarinimicrobiota bacterium]MBT3997275.1 pyridoxal 5'-phosphate synthase glutaminase subunit PdxT [Candidatus Neomarinimicrobiota bacterium]MBT4281203.1 pyridoxal 5'-phosphate synthase glutaminase subu